MIRVLPLASSRLVRRLHASLLGLAAGCALLAGASAARADGAPPPIGAWAGTCQDGSPVELILNSNGSCAFGHPSAPGFGSCAWSGSSAGGILNVTWNNAGRPAQLTYGVTWVNGRSFYFYDPYFRALMHPA
jgi:hypothetical protein